MPTITTAPPRLRIRQCSHPRLHLRLRCHHHVYDYDSATTHYYDCDGLNYRDVDSLDVDDVRGAYGMFAAGVTFDIIRADDVP